MDESFVRAWPDDPRGNAWFVDGAYRLASRQPGEFVAVRAPLAEVPRDVTVSGTFRKVGGPVGGGYGLVVADQGLGLGDGKDQSGQFIVAEVGDRGEVGIWRRDGQRWIDLMPWTRSSAVRTDTSANDMSVEVVGERLTFVVNDERVAELTGIGAGRQARGEVGVFAGGDLNEVVVSRFRVQAPAPAANPARTVDQAPTPRAQPQSRSTAVSPAAQPAPSQTSGSGVQSSYPDVQRVRDLLAGIAQDVGGIAESFSGGPDDPHSPVSDPNVLKQDQDRLAAATANATRLLAELRRIQNGAPGGR